MLRHLLILSSLLIWSLAYSQTRNQDTYQLNIEESNQKINIDGVLEEAAWQTADKADQFWEKFPNDKKRAEANIQTEVKMTYDDDFLYIGIVCHDTSYYVIQTLKRDQDFWDGDCVSILLDPVNNQSSGYMFGINPMGVQFDAMISQFEPNGNWDAKWYAEVTRHPDKWIVEVAIPFKSIRYEPGKVNWGINFIRGNRKRVFYYSWAHIPLQYPGFDLGYTGLLRWDKAPKVSKSNIAIIPYITSGVVRDYENEEPIDYSFNAGFDAKIAVSSSLNLDITVNPDFSQVEVDQQQTNVGRFSLFFPERRNFFLENSDLFSDFGIPPIRPFFSRRIGLDDDGNPLPILFGARLSGFLNKDLRVGLMTMQTNDNEDNYGQNYTVGTFQHRLFKRSRIMGIATNRQAFDQGEMLNGDYNRTGGLEFNYTNTSGSFSAWSGYHLAYTPETTANNHFYLGGVMYRTRNIEFLHSMASVGRNYITDMGFTPRLYNYNAETDETIRIGFNQTYNELSYKIFPEGTAISVHELGVQNYLVFDAALKFQQRNTTLYYAMELRNSSSVRVEYSFAEEKLPFPTEFTNAPIPARLYGFQGFAVNYGSDLTKNIAYQLRASAGSYYNGSLTNFGGGIRYLVQPWGNFGVNLDYNFIDFPETYGDVSLWLISPRIEFNFSRNLFWTTFLQYNTQAENFNINSRLQWRFQPMSDVFLVYTDNYLTTDFSQKSKALVLKVNYWLNL